MSRDEDFAAVMDVLRSFTRYARERQRMRHGLADICRYENLQGAKWTILEVKRTLKCAVSRWPVPGGYPKALSIAARESGLYWHAKNAVSGACGIFQHLPKLWPGREDGFDKHLALSEGCFNARSNILVTARMVHNGGWGPWGG